MPNPANTASHYDQGFLLSAQSFDRSGRACIQLWLHSSQGPSKLVVEGEKPVFFIAEQELSRAQSLLEGLPYQQQALPLKTFTQQGVIGLYFVTIAAHKEAAQRLKYAGIEVFEDDIKLHERYLTERFCYASMWFTGNCREQAGVRVWRDVRVKAGDYRPELSFLSIDIECSEKGELYSIGLYGPDYQQVLMIGAPEPSNTPITWVENELALLQAFEQVIAAQDPDVLIGWNVLNFDVRLLIKRAEVYQHPLRIGREGASASWRDRQEQQGGFASIAGRVVIDGIDALKTATYQFDSFSLEFVAQELLGRGKLVDHVHDRLAEIKHNFLHDKPQLAAYNLEDCKLVVDIFEHTHLLDFLCLRAGLTGLALDRVGGSVAAFTNGYLPKLHRAGYVAPNRQSGFVADSPGGYVMNSRPGLYQHVLVLDFKSLYPSIIRTFKIDPLGLIEGLQQPEQAIEGFRGGKFSREQHFLPQIITELWQQRDQAKLDQDKARSQAIKILMNSFYGVLGSLGCRFHDPRLASSITMRGHQLMQDTAEWIEQQGHQVIYGDTDSTFVWLDGDYDATKAKQVGQTLSEGINRYWQQRLLEEHQLDSHLEIEFETYFAHFLMPTIRGSETGSKKRYAGMTEQQQLVIKGLETVRSDWTPLAKHFQTGLLERVFKQQDPSEFVLNTVEQLLAGELDQQLIYKKRLRRKLSDYQKNVPPQVRAARLADERNQQLGKPLQYQRRGTIKYWITTNGPEPYDYQQSPLDYQHYLDKQLQPIADAILPFVNLSFDDLTNNQLGLF